MITDRIGLHSVLLPLQMALFCAPLSLPAKAISGQNHPYENEFNLNLTDEILFSYERAPRLALRKKLRSFGIGLLTELP